MAKKYKAETERMGGHGIALQEGKEAFEAGKDQGDCPYPVATSPFTRNLWMQAWYAAQRDAAAKHQD